jgi:hypothetical protein
VLAQYSPDGDRNSGCPELHRQVAQSAGIYGLRQKGLRQKGLGGTSTDNGTIGLTGVGSSAALMLDGKRNPGSTFNISGSRILTLGGLGPISGGQGDEMLVNGSGHTITGDGAISNLSLTNDGNITASTGNLILDVSSTGGLTNAETRNRSMFSAATSRLQAVSSIWILRASVSRMQATTTRSMSLAP